MDFPLLLHNISASLPLCYPGCDNIQYGESSPHIEFKTVEFEQVDFSVLDLILLSNSTSFGALPLIPSSFSGMIIASEPSLTFGLQHAKEICEWLKDVGQEKRLYSSANIKRITGSITPVRFREEIKGPGNVWITGLSSGHSLGSTNWKISTNCQSILVFTKSSIVDHHTTPIELPSTLKSPILLLSDWRPNKLEDSLDITASRISTAAVDSLHRGGSVLVPVLPSSNVLNLIELFATCLESTSFKIYFISPIADFILQYANILPEWTCSNRKKMANEPLPPFAHDILIKTGRLIILPDLKGIDFRRPCLIITGHPCLRFGPVVHLLHRFRLSPHCSLILTEPSLTDLELVKPYQPMTMNVFQFDLDYRLTSEQILNRIIPDINPINVIIPLGVSIPFLDNANSITYNQPLILKRVKTNEKGFITEQLAKTLNPKPIGALYCASFHANLSTFDGNYQFFKENRKPTKFALSLSYSQIISSLENKGILDFRSYQENDTIHIEIRQLNATLILRKDCETEVSASPEAIKQLRIILSSAVKSFI